MTPDEVRMLDNEKAILFIRGERPILDTKYDITKHENFQESVDGNGQPFIHGQLSECAGQIQLVNEWNEVQEIKSDGDYIVLDSDEIEEILEEQKKGGQ